MSLLLLGVLLLGYVAGFVSGRMLIGPKVQLTVENIAENVNIPKEINYIQCRKYMKVLFMSHYDGFDFFGAVCSVSLGVRSGRQWYVDWVIHASYGSSPVGVLWFILGRTRHLYKYISRIHPAKLRWNPKWRALFSWVICRFHVYFPGCIIGYDASYPTMGEKIWYYEIWYEMIFSMIGLWESPFWPTIIGWPMFFFGAVGFFFEIAIPRIYSPYRPIKSAAFSNLTGSLEIHVSKNPQRTPIWMERAEDDDYISICYNPCICHSSILNFGNIVRFPVIRITVSKWHMAGWICCKQWSPTYMKFTLETLPCTPYHLKGFTAP